MKKHTFIFSFNEGTEKEVRTRVEGMTCKKAERIIKNSFGNVVVYINHENGFAMLFGEKKDGKVDLVSSPRMTPWGEIKEGINYDLVEGF